MASGLAHTIGGGTQLSVGFSVSDEVGVVYGADGRYGCFLTTCIGGEVEVEIADFISIGFYNTYDDVRGTSIAIVEEVEIAGVVNFSTSQILSAFTGELIGTEDCVSIGVSAVPFPISAGVYDCSTIVDTVIGNEAPFALCTDITTCADAETCTALVDVNSGSFDPDADVFSLVQAPPGPYAIGSHAVTLTATDSEGSFDSCVSAVSINDCTAPSIACPAAMTAECQGSEQALVDPDPASANDCSQVTLQGPAEDSYPLGTTTVVYSANDSSLNSASCSTTISVVDTMPPSITCPADTTAECESFEQAQVDPGDATASDVCSDVTVTDPGFATYPLGATTVSYSASDTSGNSSTCNASVSVVDTTAPLIASVVATPSVLWPPNHELNTVEIGIVASDVCDPTITCGVVSVASNEADSGDTSILDADTVSLRAERDGAGSGRTYVITVICSDDTGGNSSQATTTVVAPHDQRDS